MAKTTHLFNLLTASQRGFAHNVSFKTMGLRYYADVAWLANLFTIVHYFL